MRVAVLQFPGSNCDQDCVRALRLVPGLQPELVWHHATDLSAYHACVLPGGFSYGDYLRCGAIARYSPVLQALRREAEAGKPVIGICNGFQILCESGLLPGALVRNRDLHFICDTVTLRVEPDTPPTPFTRHLRPGQLIRLPIAHGEGAYYADSETLRSLQENRQILLRYATPAGDLQSPNGSLGHIAAICNPARNVIGLMPHPERACEPRLGSTDGLPFLQSILQG